MRKFLLSFLVLVMFMPSLACAGFLDHRMSQKPAEMSHCAKHHEQKSDSGTMLFKDCAKIDLQQADDAPVLKKPDMAKVSLPVIMPQVSVIENFAGLKGFLVRGPPRSVEVFSSYPPPYLATLRLRI